MYMTMIFYIILNHDMGKNMSLCHVDRDVQDSVLLGTRVARSSFMLVIALEPRQRSIHGAFSDIQMKSNEFK